MNFLIAHAITCFQTHTALLHFLLDFKSAWKRRRLVTGSQHACFHAWSKLLACCTARESYDRYATRKQLLPWLPSRQALDRRPGCVPTGRLAGGVTVWLEHNVSRGERGRNPTLEAFQEKASDNDDDVCAASIYNSLSSWIVYMHMVPRARERERM